VKTRAAQAQEYFLLFVESSNIDRLRNAAETAKKMFALQVDAPQGQAGS
jgi:hypothetical protein